MENFTELYESKKKFRKELNEGTTDGTINQKLKWLNPVIEDMINGVKGMNGGSEGKHSNATEIVKELKVLKKNIDVLIKKKWSDDILWFRD